MWQKKPYRRWWRPVTFVCVFSLITSGALDAWRGISSQDDPYSANPDTQIFTRAQMDVAEGIKKLPPRALILHAPAYNAPTYLTGRRIMIGYIGHVWPHGIDVSSREAEVRSFLAGEAGSEEVLKRNNVDYFIIGPQEREYISTLPSTSHWNRWKKVEDIGEYSIYSAR
jgi:hypothetical protein